MATIISIVLAIIAAICAIGWISAKISARAMVHFIHMKEYTPPTQEELMACIRWASRKTFSKKP